MWQPRLWRTACGAGSTNRYAGDPISSILPSKTEHDIRLFGGLCGLTLRRRCRPGSGAARAEPVFPTKREGPARRRRRHAVAAEALVPPDAGSSRRDSYRDSRRNSVHKRPKTARRGPILPFVYTIAIPRPPTTQAHGATVYTNAPKRPRGVISTDLCTLLRRRPGGEAHVALAVTPMSPVR